MHRTTGLPRLSVLLLMLGWAFSAHASAPIATPQASISPSNQQAGQDTRQKTKKIGIILFDKFETLDVFGPVQMLGRLRDYELVIVTQDGKPATSAQGLTSQATYSFASAPQLEIVLVPGGAGTRTEVNNPRLLAFLREQDKRTELTTSVCTGSALLAKARLLEGRRATTNKLAYAWATSQSAKVQWQPRARWVVDGKYMTSSGVSAGTDMALALVEKLYGRKAADEVAQRAEYRWNDDPTDDPFATTPPTPAS